MIPLTYSADATAGTFAIPPVVTPFKQAETWKLTSMPVTQPLYKQHDAVQPYIAVDTSDWIGAAIPLELLRKYSILKPMEEIRESVRPMLTNRMKLALRQLLPLIARASKIYAVPVSKVVISGFVDPEEDSDKVVVTQWVDLPSRSALAYWDKLGLLIEEWRRFLPAELSAVVDERLAIEVDWNLDAPIIQPT